MSDPHDAEVAEYRPVCAMAVVGLIFGLLSVAALVDPFAWLLPILGTVFSGWALIRISRNAPELIGRKAAVAGLVLSLLLGSAAVSQRLVSRLLLGRQAEQFAAVWFDALAHRRVHVAHQLTQPPRARRPLDETLWDFYRGGPRWREELQEYANEPLIRTMLALGEKGQVRYCGTSLLAGMQGGTMVNQVFAVTFEEDGAKKTFLVNVDLRRSPIGDTGQFGWHLAHAALVSEEEVGSRQ